MVGFLLLQSNNKFLILNSSIQVWKMAITLLLFYAIVYKQKHNSKLIFKIPAQILLVICFFFKTSTFFKIFEVDSGNNLSSEITQNNKLLQKKKIFMKAKHDRKIFSAVLQVVNSNTYH